jgi:hypothetical protein
VEVFRSLALMRAGYDPKSFLGQMELKLRSNEELAMAMDLAIQMKLEDLKFLLNPVFVSRSDAPPNA